MAASLPDHGARAEPPAAGRPLSVAVLLVLLQVLAACLPVPARAAPLPKVLVLHAYHQGYVWTDNITQGIHEALGPEGARVSYFVEYMDTKRHDPAASFPRLRDLYAFRYAATRFDLVLACDDNALDFVLLHRDELFPGVPVVFCGINDFKDQRIAGVPDITGVAEDIDVAGTIRDILRLQPGLRRIVSVSDETETGQANLARLRAVEQDFPGLVFEEFRGLDMDELLRRLAQLPPDTAVLDLMFFRDAAGRTFTAAESVRLVAQASSVPVYSLWDWTVGLGVAGGMVSSGVEQGRVAGEMGLRILEGARASSLPVVRESPNRRIFDHTVLQRFHLPEDRLPADSLVLNRPEDPLHRYLLPMLGGAGLILFLLAVIVVLNLAIRARRRAEAEQARAREFLDSILDTIADPIFVKEADHRYALVNQAFCDLVAKTRAEVVGRYDPDFFPPEHVAHYWERDEFVLGTGQEDISEESLVDHAGGLHTIVTKKTRFLDRAGRTYVVGVIRDISDRKAQEERLRDSLGEKEILLKEIHHRVKNNLQIVSSLLSLQSLYLGDKQALELFTESRNRIASMALVHEELYRSQDLARVDMGAYSRRLAAKLLQSLGAEGRLGLEIEAEALDLPVNLAVPFGLLLNELLTNAVKHSHPDNSPGRLRILLRAEGTDCLLEVGDDGPGLPPGFDPLTSESLGLQLVTNLTAQLSGTLTFANESGAVFRVRFPRP